MVMSLPMTKQEFTEERQIKFRVSIATAAGVPPGDVALVKIETISSRRGSDRHLLTGSLSIDTIVKASDESAAVSMASALTQDKINSELQKAGLPMITMLEAPRAATVGPENNSTTIAAVVSTVVVVAVLLAGALFWRHRALTNLQESKPYKLSSASAAAAAAANDSEQFDSTHVMDICEHNRLKSTCRLCGAGAFGLAGAFGREDPISKPLPASLPSNPRKPKGEPEEEPDESVYILQDQIDLDAVFMDIHPSPAAVSERDTKNSPVKISAVDVDRGMTPTNFDARGEMKKTKVQNLVNTFQEAAVSVSVDHGLVIKRRELDSLSAELVPSFRERQLAFTAQTSTAHGRTVSSVPMLHDETPAVEPPLPPAGSESIQP
jgi:hypothetical protein